MCFGHYEMFLRVFEDVFFSIQTEILESDLFWIFGASKPHQCTNGQKPVSARDRKLIEQINISLLLFDCVIQYYQCILELI